MARLPADYQHSLRRNIVLYAWYKVVTKRLFLPLITLQLINVGKVTIPEVATIAIITSITQMVLQIPGGYFADRFGNRKSVLLGAIIAMPSPLFYAFMPNFWGGLIASLLFFGGWAFQSGAIEAFIHDTLIALGREREYSKVMGRSQSYGLIGNVILIALVPATYSINNQLPFLIGFVSLVAMVWLATSFKDPGIQTHSSLQKKNPFHAVKSVVTPQTILVFILAGFIGGVSTKSPEYREVLFNSIGIATVWFGITQSISSLVGAALGFCIHLFDHLSSRVFYAVDIMIVSVLLIIAGSTNNQFVVAIAFILLTAYYRLRLIIVQAKLLEALQHHYKATLLSALGFFTPVGEIIAISMLSGFISSHGYSTGYLLFGVSVMALGFIMLAPLAYRAKRVDTGV